jgi:hypothetical protein
MMLETTDRALVVDPVLCATYCAHAARLDAVRLARAVEIAHLVRDSRRPGRILGSTAFARLADFVQFARRWGASARVADGCAA